MTSAHSSWTRAALTGTAATLLLKLISFVCTQISYSWVDATVLGQASVQLELLYTSINFISREGFRLSLLRPHSDWNVAYGSVGVNFLCAALGALWHVSRPPPTLDSSGTAENNYFLQAGLWYCAASALEGLAEPVVLHTLRQLQVSRKASAEGLATVCKTVALVVFLQYHINEQANTVILAFGYAQMVYAVVYTVYLYASCGRQLVPWKPRQKWDWETLRMTMVFTIQGFFKHLLTEGDRIVLVAVSESYDQGMYALGSAYGGLAARVLLQPIEENARLLWSRQQEQKEVSTKSRSQDSDYLYQSYFLVTKFVLYLGLAFSTLAVHYTGILLHHTQWGPDAVAVLSAFCVYTAFLALNGTTEALVYAVAPSATDMGRLGLVHTVIAGGFALLAPILVQQYGTTGLVAANCIAMACRSVYSIAFAAQYFAQRWKTTGFVWPQLLRDMFPQPAVLLCFMGCFGVTRLSLRIFEERITNGGGWWKSALQHIAVGVTAGVGTLTVAYLTEGKVRDGFREFLEKSSTHSKRD